MINSLIIFNNEVIIDKHEQKRNNIQRIKNIAIRINHDPIFDYPRILYFFPNLDSPWKNPPIKIKKSWNIASACNAFIITKSSNKYCLNIKRQHKNNNIYFLIIPSQFSFIQKFTDCKRYQSIFFLLIQNYF